uniref:Uncharacterized protein n=1 Tax=Cynoglossus semilaevis TaxID=244447 RepID=A0A3P8VVD7_CYNSE
MSSSPSEEGSLSQPSPVVDEASPSSTSSFEILDMESVPAPYQEVQNHWFYCRQADDNTSWFPFSKVSHQCCRL